MTFAASLRQTDWDWFLMQKLYHARHHRLDGDVLNFVGISGGIARRYAGLLIALHLRLRRFERADKIGLTVNIGNDKTERGRPGKFLRSQELQGGGVLVPGTVLLGLALALRLVEELYRVNVGQDDPRHSADGRQVNAPRQVSAIDPADGLYTGKYLSCCSHYRRNRRIEKSDRWNQCDFLRIYCFFALSRIM